jgi:hypothetical protein
MKNSELIDDLITRTNRVIEKTRMLNEKEYSHLNKKPGSDKWSAVECYAHLVNFGILYLTKYEKARKTAVEAPNGEFHPGMLGNMMTRMMEPKENDEIKNKMKTFKSMQPDSILEQKINPLTEFLSHQERFLDILEGLRGKDLDMKITTAIKFLKMKLGDSLRLYVAHNERHLIQAENALAA